MAAALVILTLVTAQRLSELVIARRNTAALLRAGGREIGAGHYPVIVAFHTAWLLGLWWLAPGRDIALLWLAVYAVLQAGRFWVLATLGRRWTTRIIVVPGERLVAGGPYRFISHPNYVVVQGEIMVLPLVFGLTWYAVVAGIINAAILWLRISTEHKALHG